MNNQIVIRRALEADASDISDLINLTSLVCYFSPGKQCPEWFKESIQSSQILNLLKSDQMVWVVATHEKMLTGVLAVSDANYVKYFFVHPAFQKMGIGKRLWDFALRSGVLGKTVTVRSSLFAVSVYESLGFRTVESPTIFNGMHYQTMVASYD